MEEIIIALANKYPFIASIFMVMGVLRAVFKPIMSVVEAYVKETDDGGKDDAWLNKIKSSKVYRYAAYVLDYTASIKLPKKKDEPN